MLKLDSWSLRKVNLVQRQFSTIQIKASSAVSQVVASPSTTLPLQSCLLCATTCTYLDSGEICKAHQQPSIQSQLSGYPAVFFVYSLMAACRTIAAGLPQTRRSISFSTKPESAMVHL